MGIVWAPGLQAFKMMGSRAPATPPPLGASFFCKSPAHQEQSTHLAVNAVAGNISQAGDNGIFAGFQLVNFVKDSICISVPL